MRKENNIFESKQKKNYKNIFTASLRESRKAATFNSLVNKTLNSFHRKIFEVEEEDVGILHCD